MFKNYFKTLFRSLKRNKTSSLINVFGLAIGLASCVLIALYIQHQLSFDKFQKNGNRIARVIMQYSFEGSDESAKGNFTSVRVPMVLKSNFPEVKDAVIIGQDHRDVFLHNQPVTEKNWLYADTSFFTMFSFPLLEGNPQTALSNSHDIVLTESAAKRYFGDTDPMGKTIRTVADSILFTVTGIAKDCPKNSQIQFDFVASFSALGLGAEYQKVYWNANYTTYVLLRDAKSIAALQAKLPAFMKKEMEGTHATVNLFLEPFNKIHLYSPYDAFVPNVSITYVYILAAVALLILAIACFTYINLNTARSLERAKEVGIRKVSGAGKRQIFWQYIGEAFTMCIIAMFVAFAAAILLLSFFSTLSGQAFGFSDLLSMPVIAIALVIVLVVSFASGFYPALMLSSFQPAKVLKGSFRNTQSGQWLRKSLIVFQFAISVFLIIAAFVIQQQLYFIQHKKLGYNREHIIRFFVPYMATNIDALKTELKQNTDVLGASRTYNSPVTIEGGYNMRTPAMPENAQIAVTANPIDDEFLPVNGLQLVAGTNLTKQDMKDVANEADSNFHGTFHFILNESAAKILGWTPQEAIGKKMFLDESRPGYVRGVVKDFNFQSLRDPIKPLVLFPSHYDNTLLVKIKGTGLPQTISFIKSKYAAFFPERPFDYHFLDEDYDKLYQNETRLGNIMNIFTVIAIVLACIGLFGLSAYSVQQRAKEIGVRKVLGANIREIVFALSKDFIRLSFIASLIALPLAWWAMHDWLQDYEYRIQIHWWVFGITMAVTMAIVLLTVFFQSVRAAMANPVDSLRTE